MRAEHLAEGVAIGGWFRSLRGAQLVGLRPVEELDLIEASSSRVFRLEDDKGRSYAFKQPAVGADRRLEAIRRVAQRVDHPRMVLGWVLDEPPGVLMRWIDGEHPQYLHPDAVAPFIAQMVDLLEHLHGRGVLHRDVKPANILLDRGEVWLIDFGSAACGWDGLQPPEGTLCYMAPEAILRWEVGPSTDWYALGNTLYELLVGRLPFGSGSLQEQLLRKERGLWEPVEGTGADMWWNDLFEALLHPDPAARWGGPELLGHLLRYRPVMTDVAARYCACASMYRSESA